MFEFAEEKQKFIVTSALPYVNGVKHLGNLLGSLLPADVYGRYLRSRGQDVVVICGTDEHGTPAELGALEEGLPIQEYVDKYYAIQKKIYDGFGLSFDFFGRTSAPENHVTTQELFKAIYDNGFITEKTVEGAFCRKCERFLPDRYIQGTCPHCGNERARGDQCEACGKVLDPVDLKKPYCVVCRGSDIIFKPTKHLFFALPKLEAPLKKWLESHDELPPNARNFALGWLKDGLRERCITRDLAWGVKVPLKGFEDKVFYVWFDAPIGYISITKQLFNSQGKPDKWKEYWRDESCRLVHFLGKDNVAFHAVLFPAMLIASKYAILPSQVKSFEFLNYEGDKFSTSRKYGVFTDEALEWFPADYWRYYLLSILPEHSDADFVWLDFQSKVNTELNDVLGNLVHRCLTFTKNNFDGKVPAKGELNDLDNAFVADVGAHADKVAELFDAYRIQEALREAMELARKANKYFNDKEPWHAVKKDKAAAATTIFVTLNALRSIAILLEPFIPFTSRKILEYLNAQSLDNSWKAAPELKLEAGHALASDFKPLFSKIETKRVEELKALIANRGSKK